MRCGGRGPVVRAGAARPARMQQKRDASRCEAPLRTPAVSSARQSARARRAAASRAPSAGAKRPSGGAPDRDCECATAATGRSRRRRRSQAKRGPRARLSRRAHPVDETLRPSRARPGRPARLVAPLRPAHLAYSLHCNARSMSRNSRHEGSCQTNAPARLRQRRPARPSAASPRTGDDLSAANAVTTCRRANRRSRRAADRVRRTERGASIRCRVWRRMCDPEQARFALRGRGERSACVENRRSAGPVRSATAGSNRAEFGEVTALQCFDGAPMLPACHCEHRREGQRGQRVGTVAGPGIEQRVRIQHQCDDVRAARRGGRGAAPSAAIQRASLIASCAPSLPARPARRECARASSLPSVAPAARATRARRSPPAPRGRPRHVEQHRADRCRARQHAHAFERRVIPSAPGTSAREILRRSARRRPRGRKANNVRVAARFSSRRASAIRASHRPSARAQAPPVAAHVDVAVEYQVANQDHLRRLAPDIGTHAFGERRGERAGSRRRYRP